MGAASERSFGAMSGGVAHVGLHAEDSGLLSEASFGALSCGGASFGRSEGGGGSEGEGEGDVECERSFGALSGGVRSERSGALSEVSFGGGGSVAGVSYARSEGCGASSEEGDGGGGGVRSGLSVGAASERSFGAMSGGVAHVGVHAEDSGLLSEASFGALSCGGMSFGRSEGGAGDSEGEGEGEVECERSFGALSGGVRSERSGAIGRAHV